MKLLATLCLSCIYLAAHTQTVFQKSLGRPGSDFSMKAHKMDNGFALSGTSNDRMFLARTNANGDTLWTHTYAGSGALWGFWSQPMADGGFVIVGDGFLPQDAGGEDVVLAKTDANGELQWSKVFGTSAMDYGTAVAVADDGIFLGGAVNVSVNANDALLIKTNLQGDTLWTRTFGGAADENINALLVEQDGSCIALGTTTSFNNNNNSILLTKWSADGDLVWSGIYANSGDTYGFGITASSFGYVVPGVTTTTFTASTDGVLLMINEDFNVMWSTYHGGPEWDSAVSTDITDDGIIYTLGQSYSYGVNSDLFVTSFGSDGVLNWAKAYGGDGYEFGETMLLLNDGFFITGGEESFGSDRAIYMVRADLAGNSYCNEVEASPSTGDAQLVLTEVELTVHSGMYTNTTTLTDYRGMVSETHCEDIGTEELGSSNAITAYPNPFQDSFTISGVEPGTVVRVYDGIGRCVSEQLMRNDNTVIDMQGLAEGVYVVRCGGSELMIAVKR